MASSNLESFYRTIKGASRGESVRDAIINAARNVYKVTSNSGSLNGIPASGFAKYEEFVKVREDIYKNICFDSLEDIEDDSHAVSSNNLMTSGNLYMYLETKLRPFLAKIMNYEIDPYAGYETKEAINEYISNFAAAKDAITDALIAKGQRVPKSAKFRDYGDIIRGITDGDPRLEADAEFTENKKYDANDNKDPRFSHAYESFKINVKNLTVDGGTLDTNHKTYTPPEGKLFSKVNINIAGAAGYSGSYGRTGRTTGTGDDLEENGLLKSKTFTENGEYDAESEDAVHGWANLSVHVTLPELDAGTTFTVEFVQEQEDESVVTLDTVQVAAYDVARYTGETPTHPDPRYEFYGWEPVPSMVVSNMTCKAKFKIKSQQEAGEISDSWEMIIANRGGPYNKGDYKTMHVGTINGHSYGDLIFMKVYEGEDSTTSTWLMKNSMSMPSGVTIDGFWPESTLRTFLNGQFMEDLSTITEGKLLVQNVIPVSKRTMAYYPAFISACYYSPIVETETFDSIWIPSIREMVGEYPYDIWEKSLKLYYDGIKPDVDPTVDVIRSMYKSIAHGPDSVGSMEESHRYESTGADYSEAHGGVTKTYSYDDSGSPKRVNIAISFTDASKYKKSSGTGTDDPVYGLRSFGSWTYPGSVATTPEAAHYGLNSGGIGKGVKGRPNIAIGFCL